MNREIPPLESWQFFHACCKQLGISHLQKLFKRSQTQIYRWARDPATGVDVEKNPIDRLMHLLREMDERGKTDVVVGVLDILVNSVGYDIVRRRDVVPDGETLEDELLDDYPAVVNFHNAIRLCERRNVIQHLCEAAKREIQETYVKAVEK
ncbi:MAG: hypothetical protein HGJ93_00625 [Desulfosarcina sp.]|nr:hypothetical protein [Desulfosarcina sp.]MBC2764490.1 hypothetical protein [Desulfosarcina sp.]